VDQYFVTLAFVLLITMLAALARIIRGPKPADRMLGVQLSGTTTVAVLLALAEAAASDALRNVALVFVLLSLLVLIAFVERTPPGSVAEEERR
jgi:multicomponent Na+:H+ antiporter subunit F